MRESPEEIAERIVWGTENEFVSEMTAYLINQLESVDWLDPRAEYYVMRMANENPAVLTDIYLKYKDRISEQAREILEPYVRDIDTERALMAATGLAENSKPYTAAVERLVNATVNGCVEIINRQNVALVDNQADVWYQVSMNAVSRYAQNTASTRDIIADAVRDLMASHIQTVDYKSGIHTSIDAAIRRHIVTQVNQNYQRMTDLRAKEYDWDLFMCSTHGASRPEHYDFQGEVFSKGQHIGEKIDGHRVRDYDEMGIGDVTGIYGANCRHYTTVYIPGLSQTQEQWYSYEENEKRYELTQRQRYYERQIRQTKADIAGLRQAGLDDTAERLKLGRQQARIRTFCEENDLTRRYDLERAYGISQQPRGLRGKTASYGNTSVNVGSGGRKRIIGPNISQIEMGGGDRFDMQNYIARLYGDPTPMSFADADTGNVNPNYGKRGYSRNCQTCAVVYELRRRGFNIEAKPRVASNKTMGELAKNPSSIWSNSTDLGPVRKYDFAGNTSVQALHFIGTHVGEGQRFSMAFYNMRGNGHVVSVERDNSGALFVYDPQTDKIYRGPDLSSFIVGIRNIDQLFRVDNAIVDPAKVADIAKVSFTDAEIPR